MSEKQQPTEKHVEKQSNPGDKAPAGTAITHKDDNRIQQLQERREALATARLTKDPSKGLQIDMGNGTVVEDARGFKGKQPEQATQTQDIDYEPQKISESKFALGVDREQMEALTPAQKLQDFLQAAARRASDPEGWKAWAQSEINKFAGIGAGLNEAKDDTKRAVAAGWKALTDGSVVEFLSHPGAINRPVFKVVADAFEAMGKDPEAVNHAMEKLGKLVLKASDQYSNLPDYEKGKVIGNAMFAMINPEGDLEDGAAALKVASQPAGAGGEWPVINERPSSDVVCQTDKRFGCVAACGEMLSGGSLKQGEVFEAVKTVPEKLKGVLGPGWEGGFIPDEKRETAFKVFMQMRKPWAAEFRDNFSHHVGIGHLVVVDGLDEAGNVMIRDPQHGTRYEMTQKDFMKYWSNRAVFRKQG